MSPILFHYLYLLAKSSINSNILNREILMFRRETLLSRCIVLEILAANLLISLGYGRLFHFLFFRLYCPQVNKIRKIDSAVTIDSLVSGFSECEPVSAPESPLWRCCFLTLTAGPWTWLCVSHGWFRHSSANCWTSA